MKREIIVVNDFYKNPEEVVQYAMSLAYCNPYAYSWATTFFRRARECPFKSSPEFIKTLEGIIGEEIDLEHWNKDFPEDPLDGRTITPRPDLLDPTKPVTFDNLIPNATSCRWNCAFNIKYNDQPLGTGVHNHARDLWNSVGSDGWAGLVYLNQDAPRESGLKIFKNRYGDNLEWMSSSDRWELVDEFANVYNRLILVRGWMPHAGGTGFGDSLETGRLFQTLFFKTKKTQFIESFQFHIE